MISTIKRIGAKCTFYKLMSRIAPGDNEITSACDRIGAYRYLRRYRYVLDGLRFAEYNPTAKRHTRVWVCWLQGYDNAPNIVKHCIDSIRKYCSSMEVILIDENNIGQYIDIPSYIEDKHSRGIVPNAHYADYIRVALLERYGGVWIDATVLLTGGLPETIEYADLFCFKTQPMGKAYASNWFIAAAARNPFIVQIKALLEEYWRREKRLVSYSIFHIFWALIVDYSEENRKIWESVPFLSDIDRKILQMEMFHTYSEKRMSEICKISPIHKLTYKFSDLYEAKTDTFYRKLFIKQ